jgi:ankyrin repeat protein
MARKNKDDLFPKELDLAFRTPTPILQAQAHRYAEKGRLAELKAWVAAGGAVDVLDAEGNTPLLYAAWGAQLDTLTWLLDQGAKVTQCNVHGRNALHNIANRFSSGDYALEELKVLLRAGADVNQVDKEGRTPALAEGKRGFNDKGSGLRGEHLAWLGLHGADLTQTRDHNHYTVEEYIENASNGDCSFEAVNLIIKQEESAFQQQAILQAAQRLSPPAPQPAVSRPTRRAFSPRS